MPRKYWRDAELDYFQKVIDEEIDKQMLNQYRIHSLHGVVKTLKNVGLFSGLKYASSHRLDEEEWRSMGCPSANYALRVVYYEESDDGLDAAMISKEVLV